jgi:hypothetical protein
LLRRFAATIKARRLARDLELTLHFFHTGGQCNVASIALGLSIFDALHTPVSSGGGRRIDAFDDNPDQAIALCITRTNNIGQGRFECGLGIGLRLLSSRSAFF